MKTGFVEQFSTVPEFNTNNKIPEYAKNYKKEYLLIRGINKELKYFVDYIDNAGSGLFESHRVDRIKYFIKRFLRGQEKGKLKDISNFEIDEDVVVNLIEIKKNFDNFNQFINFCFSCYDEENEPFINPYPGFENIYYDFISFSNKLNIKYEEDSDSDSDSEFENVYVNGFSDSDSE